MIPDVLDAALECGRRQKVGRYESYVETNRISHGEWRRFFFIAFGVALAPAQAALNPLDDPRSALYVSDSEEELFLKRSVEEFEKLDREGEIRLQDGTTEDVSINELIKQMEEAEVFLHETSSGYPTESQASADQIEKSLIESESSAVSGVSPAIQTQTARWNWNSFANCTANGLGVKAAQEIVKAFAEPKVRKALKSKQYKKASSIAFNILKKTSPKIASFIIKRAANAALPGGVVTFFAIPVGKCAVKELFNRR